MGLRRGFLVSGDSMSPTLNDGDVVLIDYKARFAAGDIVLARHPYKKSVRILKRIERIDEQDRFWLVGDNQAESSDSRTFGAVSKADLLGKVTSCLRTG
jgi:nickel-type superoxide dismutase maturation protease